MNLITSLQHAYAIAAQNIVRAFKFVEQRVLPTLQKVAAQGPTVEAVTSLVDPAAANIERLAFAVLAECIKALEDAGTAVTGGLSVSLDSAFISDLRAIIPAVKSEAAPLVASITSPK